LILPQPFYDRPTLEVAHDLVGKVLVHRAPDGLTAGVIVEVEAYIGEDDPACHAAAGPTTRNAPLYGAPGLAYVYFNYGLHYLVNAVTEREGFPAAVLIRALEPVDGRELMHRRRARAPWREAGRRGRSALSGSGNLATAMGIDLGPMRARCSASMTIEDRGIDIGPVTWGRASASPGGGARMAVLGGRNRAISERK
jgi:DNA-3-methyladenine glycosylase